MENFRDLGAKTRRMCSSKAGSEKSNLTCPGFPPPREPISRGQGYGKQKKPTASLHCFPSRNSSQRMMDLCSRLCTIWGQPGTPGPHKWVLLRPRTHAECHPESRQEPRGRSREQSAGLRVPMPQRGSSSAPTAAAATMDSDGFLQLPT